MRGFFYLLPLLAACGGTAPMPDFVFSTDLATACPNDLPSACPSPPPSWMTTIQSIVQTRCESCHAPGGQAQTVLLTTYAQVHARASTVLSQVLDCAMPPPDGSGLSPTERAALLAWLVCNAPDN